MRYILRVPSISCDHCRMRISKALEDLGIKEYEISVEKKRIELNAGDIDEVLRRLEDVGYPAVLEEVKEDG